MARRKKSVLFFFSAVAFAAIITGAYLYILNTKENAGTVKIYFVKDGGIYGLKRALPDGADQLYFSSVQLLKGPTKDEKARGYYTLIPMKTKLIRVFSKDDTAIIDLTKEIDKYSGGAARVQAMLSQIVYTLTETKGIDKVRILVSGKKKTTLGNEGYDIEKPLTRDDVKK